MSSDDTDNWIALIIGNAPSGFVEVRCPDQRRGERSHGSEFVAVPDGFLSIGDIVDDFDTRPHSLPCLGMAIRSRESGTTRDLAWLSVLWVDIDFKDTPEADAKGLIRAYPRAPHCIVRSGGGFHCYWCIQLLDVSDTDTSQMVRGKLRQLARDLHGDIAAADVARIMRVPGTWNKKTDPAIQSRVTLWDSFAPYSVDDFPGESAPERVALPVDFSDSSTVDLSALHLSTLTRQAIESGASGDESSAVQSVITALLRHGLTPGQIQSVFAAHQTGIGHSLVKRGHDAERWLALSIGNAQAYLAEREPAPVIDASEWQAPESFASAMVRHVEFPAMIIDGLLRDGDIHALVADSGVGKSWMSEFIAMHLATGRPLWGRTVKRMRVLVVQEEMTEALTLERMRKIAAGMGLTPDDTADIDHLYQPGLSLDNMGPLIRYLETRAYDLVILDSFAVMLGDTPENDNSQVSRVLTRVKREVCNAYGVQILLIHHTAKDNKGERDPKNLPRGASAFSAVCDNVWVIVKGTEDTWGKLHLVKTRAIESPGKPFMVQVRNTDNGGVEVALQASASAGPKVASPRERMADYMAWYLREHVTGLVSDVVARAAESARIDWGIMQSAFNELSLEDQCAWTVEGDYVRPAGPRVMGASG